MNIDALQEAMKNLKGCGLKMWLYLNKNQDKYRLELSRQACDGWGIKKDSYYDGIRNLEEKGYLRKSWEGSNVYYFYELPQAENKNGAEITGCFSEETNYSTVNQNNRSVNQKSSAEKQYRNNTNNTEIEQYNTGIIEADREKYRKLGF